jgi:hypothetical protein
VKLITVVTTTTTVVVVMFIRSVNRGARKQRVRYCVIRAISAFRRKIRKMMEVLER